MSRIRILNLPNDCTEQKLRDFIVKGLPLGSPPVEITDIVIKRTKPSLSQTRPRGNLIHNEQSRLGKIRMAFVGFKTSAAGRYVIKYFHNTYFRSSHICVEAAKALNESEPILHSRKKSRSLEQDRVREQEFCTSTCRIKRARNESPDSNVFANESRMDFLKGNRVAAKENDEHGGLEIGNGKDTRKKDFIEERSKATAGPSWAAEVLLPQSQKPTTTETITFDKADGKIAVYGLLDGNCKNLNEDERQALERQKTLGNVKDTEFLNNLTLPDVSETSSTTFNGDKRTQKLVSENIPHYSSNTNCKAEESPQDREANIVRRSRRVRIVNVPYTATEENVKQFVASLVGPVDSIHIPLTKDTRQSKGAVFVKFLKEEDALSALSLCNGTIFMGRLLRVSAAEEDPHSKLVIKREVKGLGGVPSTGDDKLINGIRNSSFKIKKELERQTSSAFSSNAAISWNATYMNAHTAVETMAQRMGVETEDIVTVTSKGAAVRAAIAEAHLTNEVRQVFGDEGVNFDLLESSQHNLLKPRSNTTILVKNLNLREARDAVDLSQLFLKFGALEATVFPSSGAFALFRYLHPQDARIAFARLAFKPFRNTPLFLEWAQIGSIVEDADDIDGGKTQIDIGVAMERNDNEKNNEPRMAPSDSERSCPKTIVYTLFITNIPFSATEADLRDFLVDTCPRLAKRTNDLILRLVHQQELGRAFLTVSDARTFQYCLSKLNNSSFDGRVLSCVASKQSSPALDNVETNGNNHQRSENDHVKTLHDDIEKDEERDLVKSIHTARSAGHFLGDRSDSKVPHGCDPCKIVVKNLPFEATEKDVRDLFSAFAEVRSVRVPRKNNNFTSHRENNHRGFAFVEFLSEAEAARAFVLSSTHLYGRHLVLQYAKLE